MEVGSEALFENPHDQYVREGEAPAEPPNYLKARLGGSLALPQIGFSNRSLRVRSRK